MSDPSDTAHDAATPQHKAEAVVIDDVFTPTDSVNSGASFPPAQPKSKLSILQRISLALRLRRANAREPVWTPSIFKVQPLVGVLGLCLSIGCMFVALAVLLVSHGQPVSSWPVQPTVYLAIAAAIANVALGFARYHATPIAWVSQ